MKKNLELLVGFFFLIPLLCAPSVMATPVQIVNSSFNDVVSEPNWGNYALGISGWSHSGNGIYGEWSPN